MATPEVFGTFGVFGRPIDVRPEFGRTRAALLTLLGSLGPSAWSRSTAAAPWTVRDVVAHLVGDDLNRLSRDRDGWLGGGPEPGESFRTFIDRINDEWVRGAARLSPEVLVDLLRASTGRVLELWSAADLDELGDPVSWADPGPAPVWLDCARDFTEYWVHQRQIREVVGAPDPDPDDGTHTVLDTLLRAMPLTLAGCARPDGETVAVRVGGEHGGRWGWRSRGGSWWPVGTSPAAAAPLPGGPDGPRVETGARRIETAAGTPDAPGTGLEFTDPGPLWRLCVGMLTPDDLAGQVVVSGDREVAAQALRIVSVIR